MLQPPHNVLSQLNTAVTKDTQLQLQSAPTFDQFFINLSEQYPLY